MCFLYDYSALVLYVSLKETPLIDTEEINSDQHLLPILSPPLRPSIPPSLSPLDVFINGQAVSMQSVCTDLSGSRYVVIEGSRSLSISLLVFPPSSLPPTLLIITLLS